MEASALPASVGLARTRLAIGAPLLRLRPDEQLVSLFRAGNDEAFRAIHDRYRSRMLAYTRQMLAGSPQDPEDAVQEIFVRAYAGLRANHHQLALRAWLYRIAHNRCIDELRRPHAVALEAIDSMMAATHDPVTKFEQRDSLRRLIVDVQRLPEQQRSALLMRELGGMAYADVAGALGVSVPAVKSLLVRARMGLAQASEARDTACAQIREDMIASHDRGVRTSGLARRHLRDCASCRRFRSEVRGVSRRFAALSPTLGPIGVLANLLGWGGGGAAATGTAVTSGAAAAGSGAAVTSGAAAAGSGVTAGVLAGGAGHVVTILAAALVATGGAVEIQHIAGPSASHPRHHRVVAAHRAHDAPAPLRVAASPAPAPTSAPTEPQTVAAAPTPPAPTPAAPAEPSAQRPPAPPTDGNGSKAGQTNKTKGLALTETLDPDRMMYLPNGNGTTSPTSTTTGGTGGAGGTSSSTPSTSPTSPSTPGTGPSAPVSGSPSGTTPGTSGAPGSGTTTPTAPGSGSTGAPSGSASGTGSGGAGAGTPPPAGSSTSGTGASKVTPFPVTGP